MKKLFTLFILLLCLKNSNAQYVTIPDANFVAWLQANIPSAMIGNQMDTTNTIVILKPNLYIAGLGISDLTGIQYFKSLNLLKCNDNFINNIPAFPKSLDSIICYYNQLTSLPALPNSLTYLNCEHNELISLPILPNSINLIFCEFNQLVSLPALPNSLRRLYCGINQLVSLPALPNSLVNLIR